MFTIYGISSNAKLSDFSISGNNITISKNALGEDDFFLEGEGYTLKLANDVPQSPTTGSAKWGSLVNSKATYTATSYSAYYTLEDNTVIYNAALGGEKFTISGVKSIAKTAINVDDENKVVKLFATALGTDKITLDSDDYSLDLDASIIQNPGVSERKFTALTNGTATYKIFGDKAYYTLDGNEVFYTSATADKQFTISGLANNLTLTNGTIAGISAVVNEKDKSVKFTLSASVLKDSDVTLSGTGATFELGNDVPKTAQNISEAWSEVVNGTASYSTNGKSKYYTLTSGKVVYHAPVAGDLQIKLGGLSSTAKTVDGKINGLTISGKSLTISSAAVGKNVALQYNNGFNVNLASDVKNISFTGTSGADSISNNGTNISIDGGAGNDSISNNAASNVTINTAQGNDTIKLGSSTKSFRVDGFSAGDVIQLYSSATKLETISGGIKAGNVSISGVTNISTINNSWQTSTNSIAYTQSTVAGAKLSGTKITYDATSDTANLFTISGIKSTTGVALSGKEVTLSKAALNGVTGKVSISGGDYKLKLASDVDTIAESTSGWTTLTSGNVAYLEGGKGSYYSLSGDGKSVTYNASVAGANKVELGGVKGTPTLSGTTVSLTANNFNSNVSVASNAGNYQFALSGAFGGKKFTGTSGVDKISNSGTNISIDGGKGNDSISNSGSNVTITGGAGNDVFSYSKGSFKITDYTANADKISLDIAKVEDVALKNNDVTLSLGQSDSITVANGKDKKITVAKDKTAQYIFGDHVILNAGKTSSTLTTAATKFDAEIYSSLVTIDATKTDSATNIVGNAKANKIYAGVKGSTLNGGKGNDTLIGGAGVDIFVYAKSGGNDVIQNYTSGQDKVSLGANTSVSSFSLKNSDATFKISGNNLTLKGVGEKTITVTDSAGNKTNYSKGQAVSGNGVTLNAEYDSNFTASSKIVSVDATQSTNSIVLNGNSKNNILTGGAGNDTLSGGKGNDKLFGNAGKDSISGGAGNDLLSGGDGNDTLSGGAGNDTLTGGKGKDTFVFDGGKDTITDYTAGEDKISISRSLGVGNYKVSGKNVVLTYGSNNLSIEKGLNKELTITNGATGTYTKKGIFNKDKTAVTLPSATKTFKATSYAQLVTIDSSAASSTINLTGNKKANYLIAGNNGSTLDGGDGNDTLKGGKGKDNLIGNAGNDSLNGGAGNDILKGGAGNDTLWGGLGNDSLYGGSDKDTFIYKPGEGTDTIFDYLSGDMLKILKSNGKAGGSFTKSKFSGGDLTLTINGGGKVIFDDVSAGDKFNINGTTYTIKGKSLVSK